MGYQRLSGGLRSTGYTFAIIGLIGLATPWLVPPPKAQEGVAACYGIGIFGFLIGSAMLIAYYLSYRVSPGTALITRQGRVELEGTYFGLPPSSAREIRIAPQVFEISSLEVETPDDGVLGASISVSYTPDITNPSTLGNYQDYQRERPAIESRIRAALTSWAMGKPVPGTLKRAMAMQQEAESYIRHKLAGNPMPPTENDLSLAIYGGVSMPEIGVRIQEVNIVRWTVVEHGTGKPDWGDGDHTTFDARSIIKQFELHAGSLSELRAVKEKLLKLYEDEADDIEDIYDQVRISMKETRER